VPVVARKPYNFEKRQRELTKERKKEEKRQRKLERKSTDDGLREGDPDEPGGDPPDR
jgi:hypothetical protein